jgi:pilus assembly protein CpaE
MHGNELQVFALVRSDQLREQLTDLVAQLQGARFKIRSADLKSIGTKEIYAEGADVLLIDVDLDDSDQMATLNLLRLDSAVINTHILVTSSDASTTGLRRLLREGIDDFLPQPLARDDLAEALAVARQKLNRRRTKDDRRGRVLTFIKASGGMGATTLAVNSASILINLDRKQPKNVGLLDLDVQFGANALYLDLEMSPGMVDIVRAPERLDADLLRSSMVEHKSGLRVLTAPKSPMPLEALKPELIGHILDLARQQFDYLVVDMPHALANWTDAVLGQSDRIFLVTQTSVPAIRQARRLLQILAEEGLYNLPLKVVLNRHQSSLGWGGGGRISFGQAQKALGREIDFLVSNDFDAVSDALNQGVPVLEVKRRSKFVKKVRELIERSVKELEAGQRQPSAAAA